MVFHNNDIVFYYDNRGNIKRGRVTRVPDPQWEGKYIEVGYNHYSINTDRCFLNFEQAHKELMKQKKKQLEKKETETMKAQKAYMKAMKINEHQVGQFY